MRNQLYIALIVKYINKQEFDYVNNLLLELSKRIGRFIYYLENERKKGNFKPVNALTR